MNVSSRRDANEPEIVNALRAVGCTVVRVESRLAGLPDLYVGFRGAWYAMEVKGEKGVLSEAQRVWHKQAAAPVIVVRTPEEALAALGAWRD